MLSRRSRVSMASVDMPTPWHGEVMPPLRLVARVLVTDLFLYRRVEVARFD